MLLDHVNIFYFISQKGKYIEETTPYIENLLKYLYVHLKVTFKEFVCDFIKDESGIWWLINIKAFTID
jgi:LMBR1 domain-containing protein 1